MYQTDDTATGPHDLLDQLRGFAESIGWTIDRFESNATVPGSNNGGTWLQLHHADAGYHNFVANNSIGDLQTSYHPLPIIYAFSATGVDLNSDHFKDQPGSSWPNENNSYYEIFAVGGAAGTCALRGPYTAYHFFGTSRYLHVCVEIVAGEFAHFGVGMLEKNGAYAGGEYGYGTPWEYQLGSSSSVSYYADSFKNNYFFKGGDYKRHPYKLSGYSRMDHPNYPDQPQWALDASVGKNTGFNSASAGAKNYDYINLFGEMWDLTPNTINGLAPLIPISLLFQLRDTNCYMQGQVRDTRFVNIKNLTPGSSVTLGADEWMVFPIKSKGPNETGRKGTVNSWHYGVAYRKVP